MARVNLSDQLERRVGTRTSVKRDEAGNKVGGGTLITSELVSKVKADEAGLVEIRQNNLEQFESAMNSAIAAALEEIGLAAERFAKLATPVDTGRLRNSMTHAISMDETAVYIGSNVEYAPYVELGTSTGRKGVLMITRAAQDHESYYQGIMKKHLQNS